MSSNSSIVPCASGSVERWDHEADVVVVGFGCAGSCAAIEAAELGADVLVLERASGGGGTAANSGGLIYLGGGTPVQRESGFEDDTEEMYKFLMAACGPGVDADKIRVFCDGSLEQFRWLEEHGVPFKRTFYPEPGKEPPTDDCLVYSGGEEAWPFNEIARPAPRAHKPRAPGAAGGFLMQKLLTAASRTATKVLEDTRAERLITDGDGVVVGVVARQTGDLRCIRARRGVVLTAGGFISNREMTRRYAPQLARANWRVGTDGDDGSGILMGMGAGADAIRMEAGSVSIPIYPPKEMKKGVLVNGHGQRFINEDTYYGRIGQRALYEQDGRCWLIVDAETYLVNEVGMQAAVVEESFTELEAKLGLAEGSLVATMDLYNGHARRGVDPVFHKKAEMIVPLDEPPYGAIDCTLKGAVYAAFTLGGLRTRPSGEVLRPDGSVVEGLYAAGRTTSGVSAWGYASGVSLADGMLFGRLAARSAAARSKGSRG
jgi:succinate dehydrogenase/fumarate reductase flavoprotein subunit